MGGQHYLHVACSSLALTLLYAYLGSRYVPRENAPRLAVHTAPGHAPQVLMLSVGSVSEEPWVQP